MTDVGYYYYFQGRFKHTGLYKSWVDEARAAGVPMRMVTSVPLERYRAKRDLIEPYESEPYVTVLPVPLWSRGRSVAILLYFLLAALRHDRIVVHVRKRSTTPLDVLKSVLGENRVKYVVEVEGDPKAEAEYLQENPYREGFYDDFLAAADTRITALSEKLHSADGLLLVTERLRDVLDERYPSANVAEKASVIPSGVDTDTISFAAERRERVRRELGVESAFVFAYVGGVYYSWQNLKRIFELYSLARDHSDREVALVLLVREKDHEIVRDLAGRAGVGRDQYVLREVPHDEVGGYLNAADMGVLLRDDHQMNRVVTTAKLGEYLVAGLPVLTTAVAFRAQEVRESGFGVVLDDMDDDEAFIEAFEAFDESTVDRTEISAWAEQVFSTSAHRDTYIDHLRGLAEE